MKFAFGQQARILTCICPRRHLAELGCVRKRHSSAKYGLHNHAQIIRCILSLAEANLSRGQKRAGAAKTRSKPNNICTALSVNVSDAANQRRAFPRPLKHERSSFSFRKQTSKRPFRHEAVSRHWQTER